MPDAVTADPIRVRTAREDDIAAIVAMFPAAEGFDDAYWRGRLRACTEEPDKRFFLAAEHDGRCVGAILGEVRALEFRSRPSGNLFATVTSPESREAGIGSVLFEALCDRFTAAGVDVVRAMVRKDEALDMAFLRSQGMTAGPFVQMQMRLPRHGMRESE
ncbi:MAG: GNAT family N-acetyltransferase [Tetrasphaera sp.]